MSDVFMGLMSVGLLCGGVSLLLLWKAWECTERRVARLEQAEGCVYCGGPTEEGCWAVLTVSDGRSPRRVRVCPACMERRRRGDVIARHAELDQEAPGAK